MARHLEIPIYRYRYKECKQYMLGQEPVRAQRCTFSTGAAVKHKGFIHIHSALSVVAVLHTVDVAYVKNRRLMSQHYPIKYLSMYIYIYIYVYITNIIKNIPAPACFFCFPVAFHNRPKCKPLLHRKGSFSSSKLGLERPEDVNNTCFCLSLHRFGQYS